MIKGLFETHLYVADLEQSIAFYKDILGLEQCHIELERQVAFFWIGEPNKAMLGIWQKPKSEIHPRHFAFQCELDFVLNEASAFLKSKGLKATNFLQDGTDQPMVFAWMPALSIYFKDPDGNSLEFIAMLDGEGNKDLGVISYTDWLNRK